MSDPKIIEVMLVFHRPSDISAHSSEEFGGELYFSTTAPQAIADRYEYVDRGYPVVILPISEEVLPLLRGQRVSLGPL
jgi:hypothetical protein